MLQITLSSEEKQKLELKHQKESNAVICDRIKAILLRSEGWSRAKISQSLRVNCNTVTGYIKDYVNNNKVTKASGGSHSKLCPKQISELLSHLEDHLYVKCSDIVIYVKSKFNVSYSIHGMKDFLHRNGFSYKKPKGLPLKADIKKQKFFIKFYNKIKNIIPESAPLLFIDSVHPTQSTKLSCGWIRKGKDKAINTNGSRTRINICGAINMKNMDVIAKEYNKSINNDAIIDFFREIKSHYRNDKSIYIICDQAGYHKGEKIEEFLKQNPEIRLRYLPTYSPNLNPIERLWKVMNEKARNNKYFAAKKEFRQQILNFFNVTVHEIKEELKNRITDNFQILDAT